MFQVSHTSPSCSCHRVETVWRECIEGVSSVTDVRTRNKVTQEIMSRDGGAGGDTLPGEIACENQESPCRGLRRIRVYT